MKEKTCRSPDTVSVPIISVFQVLRPRAVSPSFVFKLHFAITINKGKGCENVVPEWGTLTQ